MQAIALETLDLVTIACYLLAVLIIGVYVARRTHDADDLFLAGRRLGWIPVGLSLFAANISSTTRIGLAGVTLVPPVVTIFLLGLCCRRAGAGTALATLVAGNGISAAGFIATLCGVLELLFTLIAGLLSALSSGIYWLMWRATRDRVATVATRHVWQPATARASVAGPWWRDYRVSAAVLPLTLWTVLAFR